LVLAAARRAAGEEEEGMTAVVVASRMLWMACWQWPWLGGSRPGG
jgi:hypothetical protein